MFLTNIVYLLTSIHRFFYCTIHFLLLVYICAIIGDSDPLNGCSQPHVCSRPKQGPRFSNAIFLGLFVLNDLRREVTVRFVYIYLQVYIIKPLWTNEVVNMMLILIRKTDIDQKKQ